MKQKPTLPERVTPTPRLAERIEEALGQNVYLCYQCVKCTSGCPLVDFFDWQPNQIMRALQLGEEEIALHAETPWLCAACQTCTSRCPQGLDVNAIMEFLTREALARDIPPPVREVQVFYEAFMREVRLWGRAYEVGLMAEIKARTRDFSSDLDLGAKMIRKRKLAFLPSPVRRRRHVPPMPEAATAVAYYPGCSLHSTATEFNASAVAVCEQLGLNLVEPRGWVCCGSSAAHRADPELALQLPLENLALIEQSGFAEVTMPCAACFNRHKAALHEIRHDEDRKAQIDEALDYNYQNSVRVSSLSQLIGRHPDKVKAAVRRPLTGLRVVSYYGCLLTRPPEITEAPHPENPTDLDELLAAAGAEVVDWSYKTVCCGAAHSLTRPDIVHTLSRRILEHARDVEADVIAVACPLCHTNLDARQFQMGLEWTLPVLYFTQLLALALDLPARAVALEKNLVDPRPLLVEKGLWEVS